MRLKGIALAMGALAVMACAGGENNAETSATDTTGVANGQTGAATTGTASAAPITGTTHEVQMIGDERGYRFEPANITIKQGDGIKWVMVSGGPHNVAFDPAAVPAAAKAQLSANMPNQMTELSSPMMMNPPESYTISFANIPPGTYDYNCTPHLALGMVGKVTVE